MTDPHAKAKELVDSIKTNLATHEARISLITAALEAEWKAGYNEGIGVGRSLQLDEDMGTMTDPNDPAFPIEARDLRNQPRFQFGLTKREYYAGLAMQGMMTLPPDEMLCWAGIGEKGKYKNVGEWIADNSIVMADALIAGLRQIEGKTKIIKTTRGAK